MVTGGLNEDNLISGKPVPESEHWFHVVSVLCMRTLKKKTDVVKPQGFRKYLIQAFGISPLTDICLIFFIYQYLFGEIIHIPYNPCISNLQSNGF